MDFQEAKRLAGGMLVVGFDGTELDLDTAARIAEIGPSGVILFKRNYRSPEQVLALTGAVRKAAGGELLVAVDQEGGRVNRFGAPFTAFPSAREIGATGNDYLAYEVGMALARELMSVGVNLDFAPVLDVDTNPKNPVIGDRSFGGDPYLASRMAVQMLTGMQDGGLLTCGKHFPGHGDTFEDSHLKLPRVGHSLDRLMDVELVPFGSAVDAGVDLIMTAHVIVGGVDGDNPATMSRVLLNDLLKVRLGFSGPVISDDLEMKAIADNYGVPEAAVRSIAAGADLLLVCHSGELQLAVRDALAKAIHEGGISADRVSDAVWRIDALRKRIPSRRPDAACVGCDAHSRLAGEIRELARG
jgi:beta-N-acetylhexosaminidase